jgi:hypothetical protein
MCKTSLIGFNSGDHVGRKIIRTFSGCPSTTVVPQVIFVIASCITSPERITALSRMSISPCLNQQLESSSRI